MLKLFFMSDKSLKTIQQAQDILKSILKDSHDKQTVDEKIKHTMQKLQKSKVEIRKHGQTIKKQTKANMKELNKQKEKVRLLDIKLQESSHKPKHSEVQPKKKENQVVAYQDENQTQNPNYKYLYEREKRKKRQGQQKLRQYKQQNQKLQEKLAEKQRQIQNLRQQMEVQKLLLEEFANQQSQNSSENERNEDQQEQSLLHIGLLEQSDHEVKMMDLSQGGPPQSQRIQDEPRKLSQQQQTDDQFQEQDQPLPQVILAAKVSQIEQFEGPELKNQISEETQASSLTKSTEYSSSVEAKPQNCMTQTETKIEAEIVKEEQDKKVQEQNPEKKEIEVKKSRLFSWIGWWKTEKK